MSIEFSQHAWEEFNFWVQTDPTVTERICELIDEISHNPFKGTGKPEPLKFSLQGYWSRRITGEHRLVYKVEGKNGVDQTCFIVQCRFHYDD